MKSDQYRFRRYRDEIKQINVIGPFIRLNRLRAKYRYIDQAKTNDDFNPGYKIRDIDRDSDCLLFLYGYLSRARPDLMA